MNKNDSLTKFLQKVSNIFDCLNLTEGKEEIVKNLVGSFLLNFSRIIAQDERSASVLSDYSQASDSGSDKLFEFLDSKSIDYKTSFDQAQKETLQSFVSELTPDLTPEKVEELNKIIS